MASAFTHIAVPVSIFLGAGRKKISLRLLLLGFFLSIVPDLDSLGFKMGVPYESQWGHRGFTHSILFAAVIALLLLPFERFFETKRRALAVTAFVSMASHGILDALTNGGLGVAFFWPFSQERYFFPWHNIKVSPLSPKLFFSRWGLEILQSEFVYVWLPCLFVGFLFFLLRRFFVGTKRI